MDVIAEFYYDTWLGRELRAKGRAEAFAEEFAKGRAEAHTEVVTFLLHDAFGPDPRIPTVAAHLAASDLPDAFARLRAASSLSDLLPDDQPLPPDRTPTGA